MVNDGARAEEIAQEAFARAFHHWKRVSLHPNPEAWVLRVAVNLSIDDVRRHRALPSESAGAQEPSAHDLPESAVASVVVRSALSKLPPKQRQAVALRYLAGYEEADIAAALGVNRGTVKTHLKRGVEKMRRDLGDEDTDLDVFEVEPQT